VPKQQSSSPGHNLRSRTIVWAAIVAVAGVLVAVPGDAHARTAEPRSLIVYEGSGPNHRYQVFVARPNGTHKRPLTSPHNWAEKPRWSPSGKRILYLRSTPEDRTDLMVMGAGGRHKHQLLSGQGRFFRDVAWGPAGRRVAIVMLRGNAIAVDIFIYSLDTRKLTQLHANRLPDHDLTSLDWSPDGKTIAFSAEDYSKDGDEIADSDLYLIQSNGTGLRQVTNTATRDERNPRFSPGGRWLAYWMSTGTYSLSGVACESIVIASADGTSPKRVRAGCDTSQASWSPNGRRLLVQKYAQPVDDDLWSMALDGSDRRFVTRGRNASWRPR
jgi:Tol biopolymer transport system component